MYKNCIDFSDSVKINIPSNFSFFNLKNITIYLKCVWMSIREKKIRIDNIPIEQK